LIILKRIGLVLLIILIFSAMVVFTAGNPGEVSIKLLHWEVSSPVSLAFTVAFAVSNERRMLRRSLRMSENEVSSLRSLPLSDAD
jgi:uncharacterized integral membrane protein